MRSVVITSTDPIEVNALAKFIHFRFIFLYATNIHGLKVLQLLLFYWTLQHIYVTMNWNTPRFHKFCLDLREKETFQYNVLHVKTTIENGTHLYFNYMVLTNNFCSIDFFVKTRFYSIENVTWVEISKWICTLFMKFMVFAQVNKAWTLQVIRLRSKVCLRNIHGGFGSLHGSGKDMKNIIITLHGKNHLTSLKSISIISHKLSSFSWLEPALCSQFWFLVV